MRAEAAATSLGNDKMDATTDRLDTAGDSALLRARLLLTDTS